MNNKFLKGFAGVLAAAMVVSSAPSFALTSQAAAKVKKGTKITASASSVTVVAGSSKVLSVGLNKKQTKQFKFKVKSKNTKIATVTPAKVTVKKKTKKATKNITIKGVKPGSTKVVISGNGATSKTIKVTVKAKPAPTPTVVKLTAVELNNVTPKMGEVLEVQSTPANANNIKSYQWYRTSGTEELMIKGETSKTYKVGTADVNCSIYCMVTDTSGNKFYTKETSKVKMAEVDGVKVTGMTGKSRSTVKTADIPVIGDTLNAVPDPEETADLITYQWYRGSNKITGATKSSYTVTEDDFGYALKVKVEAKDSSAVYVWDDESAATNAVCKDMKETTISLSRTNIQTGATVSVSVKDGDNLLRNGTDYEVAWYKDSISDETKVSTATTYTVQPEDVDHTIICEATGVVNSGYINTTSAATGKSVAEISNVTAASEVSGHTINTGVSPYTLTAAGVGETFKAAVGANETASFVWTVNGTKVSTSDTYTLKASDVGITSSVTSASNVNVEVTATGNGVYTGTKTFAFKITTVSATSEITGVKVYKNDSTTALATSGQTAAVGDVLTVEAVPAAATDSMNFKWTTHSGTYIGTSYTVVNEDAGYDISVGAYYIAEPTDNWVVNTDKDDENAVFGYGATAAYGMTANQAKELKNSSGSAVTLGTIAAKKGFTDLTLTYNNNVNNNKNASGFIADTAPEVGHYVHAATKPSVGLDVVEYTFYKDSVKGDVLQGDEDGDGSISGTEVNSSALLVDEDLIGHTIVCVAKGKTSTDYANAEITTESNTVKASSRTIKEIKVVAYDTETSSWGTTAVTSLTAGTTYAIVATDSEDKEIAGGVDYFWDGTDSNDYLSTNPAWEAETGNGTISVKVVPDGKNYTGSEASYTFKTEVASNPSDNDDDGIPVGFTYVYSTGEHEGEVPEEYLDSASYKAKMVDSAGHDVSENADAYVWSVDCSDDAVTINPNTGALSFGTGITATSVNAYVTATPKNSDSGLSTLKAAITIEQDD